MLKSHEYGYHEGRLRGFVFLWEEERAVQNTRRAEHTLWYGDGRERALLSGEVFARMI